jgi:hypothetical protein
LILLLLKAIYFRSFLYETSFILHKKNPNSFKIHLNTSQLISLEQGFGWHQLNTTVAPDIVVGVSLVGVGLTMISGHFFLGFLTSCPPSPQRKGRPIEGARRSSSLPDDFLQRPQFLAFLAIALRNWGLISP